MHPAASICRCPSRPPASPALLLRPCAIAVAAAGPSPWDSQLVAASPDPKPFPPSIPGHQYPEHRQLMARGCVFLLRPCRLPLSPKASRSHPLPSGTHQRLTQVRTQVKSPSGDGGPVPAQQGAPRPAAGSPRELAVPRPRPRGKALGGRGQAGAGPAPSLPLTRGSPSRHRQRHPPACCSAQAMALTAQHSTSGSAQSFLLPLCHGAARGTACGCKCRAGPLRSGLAQSREQERRRLCPGCYRNAATALTSPSR